MDKTVIILRGAPGCGKSTLAATLFKLAVFGGQTVEVCSADQFFYSTMDGTYNFDKTRLGEAHGFCKTLFTEAILNNISLIILDNTNGIATDFKGYKKFAEISGYVVHVLVVENRHGNKSAHNVPEYAVQRTKDRIAQSIQL